jgi:type III restriction enzyme
MAPSGQLGKKSPDGYTVWRWRNGRLSGAHCKNEKEAIDVAVDV